MGVAGSDVPSVGLENGTGASAAVGHLLATGRRRIATVAGPAANPCARERLAAYRSRIQAADLDAIFVASDLMATAVLQVLQAGGRRVPDDVAVIGFDDSPPAAMTTPALSTVHQPVEQLAGLAVRTLTDGVGDHALDQRLPTHLLLRSSSAA
jgi:DNA-binding LacI/PurR family transcriptional regulator